MKRIRLISPLVVGILGTILSIFLFYTDYSSLDYKLSYAFRVANKWNWLTGSVILTSFSYLFPFVTYFFYGAKIDYHKGANATYAFAVLWIPVLFLYPGSKELGVYSDSVGVYAMFGIIVSQYLTTKIITAQIISESKQRHNKTGLTAEAAPHP